MVLDLQTKDAEAALYGKRIGVLANTGAVSNKMIRLRSKIAVCE